MDVCVCVGATKYVYVCLRKHLTLGSDLSSYNINASPDPQSDLVAASEGVRDVGGSKCFFSG